ncbi:MAG TPA: GGDEF domain-containing protein [Longimicrobium sp.]|nr:GGDEF domain-containing protein [Longimicrobium sp.]
MTPDAVAGLVSYLGTATQLGGALLLAAFFLLLRGHARRRAYFRAWSMAWMWMSVALLAVFTLYRVDWIDESPQARLVWTVYQAAKLFFLASLLAGTLAYARAVRPRDVLRVALPASVAYAAFSVAVSHELNAVVALQGPVAAMTLGLCAWMMLRLPPSRASVGNRATGCFFGLLAGLWAFYTAAFPLAVQTGGTARFVVQHNSYFDLLLQVLLGFGMVVVLLEDAKREADDAHAQLAVAHDELKRVALHDSLTGALNRRAWSEGTGLEVARASFGTAVMLDLDNLKTVNDRYGHAAGDELLRRVAQALRHAVRPSDRLFRWGGDEFLLLMPGARASDARRRVERVVADSNAAIEGGDDAPLRLQLSIGTAEFSGGEDLDAAVEHADAAMYEEKSRRRTRRAAREPAPEPA